jgi:hypothetical protein
MTCFWTRLKGPIAQECDTSIGVLMAGNETGEVAVSANGSPWALATSPEVGAIYAIAGDGIRFVVAGETGAAWTLDGGDSWARNASLDALAPFDAAHFDGSDFYVTGGSTAAAVYTVDMNADTYTVHDSFDTPVSLTQILLASAFGYLHLSSAGDPEWCQSAPLAGLSPWTAIATPETTLDASLIAANGTTLMLIPVNLGTGTCKVWTATAMAAGAPDIGAVPVATDPFGAGVVPGRLMVAGSTFVACLAAGPGFWHSVNGVGWAYAEPSGAGTVYAVTRAPDGHYIAATGDTAPAEFYWSISTSIGATSADWEAVTHPLSDSVIQAIAP